MARWYKHEPAAWLGGVAKLTPEQRGIYQTILDLIYLHERPIDMDFRWLAGNCNCDTRIVKRVVGELVSLQKLGINADGKLFNNRATVELGILKDRTAQATEAGRIGGLKSSTVRNKSNYLGQATAQATAQQTRLESKKDLTSFLGTTSEQLQPSRFLIEHETKRRPTPGSLATAHFDSALTRPAYATTAAKEPSGKPFTRAEIGKPNGWDWAVAAE